MLRSALAAMALLATGAASAEAAVYTFRPEPLSPSASPFYDQDKLSFSIGIDDAAVRSGSFSYDFRYRYVESGSPPVVTYTPSAVGDVSAFQFFAPGGPQFYHITTGPQGSGSDYLAINLTFSPNGQAIRGSVDYETDGYYVVVAGSNAVFTGSAGIGFLPATRVSGQLVATVPEPSTIALLSVVVLFSLRSPFRKLIGCHKARYPSAS